MDTAVVTQPPPVLVVPEQRRRQAAPREPVPDLDATAQRARRSRLAMAVPLVLCVATVLGAGAAGTGLALRGDTPTTHTITTPDRAGDMVRDPAREPAMADRIQPLRDAFEIQFMGRLNSFVSAVYLHPDDAPGSPRGPVVLVGATVDSAGESRDFVAALTSSAKGSGYRAVEVGAGTGARGVCLVTAGAQPVAASCAWSTGDSIGQVVPTTGPWGLTQLSALMRDVRRDTESAATSG